MDINWYPGHMLKARRAIEEALKAVDAVIEVADARIPVSSRNPDFDDLFARKARMLVLNKADMADPRSTDEWIGWYREKGIEAVPFVAIKKVGRETLIKGVEAAAEEKVRRMAERGAKKTVRALVAGIPNVGKSALINALSGTSPARTGNMPGVTRGKQLIRITPWLELVDTPGILQPKLDDQYGALLLALTGAIRETALEDYPLALRLAELLTKRYPEALKARYGLDSLPEQPDVTVDMIAKKRGCLLHGGEPDEERAAKLLLNEMKAGKLGRMTLETPHELEDRRPFGV